MKIGNVFGVNNIGINEMIYDRAKNEIILNTKLDL